VQAALEKLPPEYKQVLELRFMQELSIVETAKALGKSSVATRVLQHRAMKKLEYIFKNHERT
jgi:RNA polymerase sigma-70 factor (ECF subfamily)